MGGPVDTRTGVLVFSQAYRQRDRSGSWGLRSQFNLGADLANTSAQQGADSQFVSWLTQLERTQVLSDEQRLSLRFETQLTPHHLLTPHQFTMKERGFEQFSREGRPTDISGDNGMRLRLENQMMLLQSSNADAPLLTLIPFVDLGYAWGQGNPIRANQQFLGRTGLGLLVQPLPGFDIELDYLMNWGDLRPDSTVQNVYVTFGYQTLW